MIRWAFADTRRPPTSTPRRFKSSSSPISTPGSITTPFPTAQVLPGYRIPDGIRWNLNVSPSRTMVWPALFPPWKRITRSACSASRSTTFPFPSSPHWAPTITRPGMAKSSVGPSPAYAPRARPARPALCAPRGHAKVPAPDGDRLVEDLAQPGDGARADLAAQPGDRVEIAGAAEVGRPGGDLLEALHDPLKLAAAGAVEAGGARRF